MGLGTDNFGFGNLGVSSADESQFKYFFVQLGGQAQCVNGDYVTFRNKAGVDGESIYEQIGASATAFPFNGGVQPLPKACKLVSATVTGIIEETGIANVDVGIMKLAFADGDTGFSVREVAHTEFLTSLVNGQRFNSTTASIIQTANTVYAAGDTVSLAIRNALGSGTHYINGLSVVLTFELT